MKGPFNSCNINIFRSLVILLVLLVQHTAGASGNLNFPLNTTGSTFIRASVRGQFWARLMNMNPGSTFQGKPIDQALDFSMRRVRASLQVKPRERVFIYAAVGENNINKKVGRQTKIKLLDLNIEYQIAKLLSVGVGKSGWTGLSRWNVRSSKSMMTLDAPLLYLQTVNINDDLGRSWGGWLKGSAGKWDYVFAVKKPKKVIFDEEPVAIAFDQGTGHMSYSGYVKYQFFEMEGNRTSYSGGCGTYLGNKHIFNLGAGYSFQSEMMNNTDGLNNWNEDYQSWSFEMFYDAPLRQYSSWAFTSYAGVLLSDFGEGYVRRLGANDYTASGSTWSGSGTDYPMMGTGNTLFVQVGLLKKIADSKQMIQPNIAWQNSHFDLLSDPVNVFHGGVNLYLTGHDHKVSFGFENRPVFDQMEEGIRVLDRKTNWILQYQIEIN